MKKLIYFSLGLTVALASCSKDDDGKKWVQPPSEGATMTLQGGEGEADAVNSVFVDFSANEQVSIKRDSWQLAFNCGSEFGVFLNSTNISRAKEAVGISMEKVITENELAPYTAALALSMSGDGSMDYVDRFDKSIAGTVVKEGKVYIYRNENDDFSYYKIKVAKKDANTYTLSYAKWNSSEVKSADIRKDTKYNIIGFSFSTGKTVIVEKEDWDIIWGRNTYESAMVAGVPMSMADIVFINNKGGVKGALIMEEDIAYAEYTEADIASTTLSSDIGVVGDQWRGTSGMPPVMSVKADRYFIIQDVAGNIYKLKFLAIGVDDGATRGYPVIEFQLVREAQ